MTRIKAVIFDMDGLMFDTEPIYYKANQKTADYLAMDFSFETYSQFIGIGDVDYKRKMEELYKDVELLEEFFEKSQLVLQYLMLNGQVDIKEGLINLLNYLEKENIMAIVASSSNRDLVDQLLNRLDVRKYFKDIVAGDEVSRAKPDPAIFNKAFEKTGLSEKNEVLILEDSENGVIAAHAANIPVIMVPDLIKADESIEEKVLNIFSNLNEVITYLKKNNK